MFLSCYNWLAMNQSRWYSYNIFSWSSWYSWSHGASRISWKWCISSCYTSWELSAPYSIFFRIIILFHSISPTSHRSSQYILNVTVGAHTGAILGTMRGVIALRHSYLLENHTIILYTMVPNVRPFWGFVRAQDTRLGILLHRNPHGFISIIERGWHSRGDIIYLHWCYFTFIFNLDCGQEVTPIFTG